MKPMKTLWLPHYGIKQMDNKRKRFKAHYKQRNDAFEQWCAGGYNNQDLPKNIVSDL